MDATTFLGAVTAVVAPLAGVLGTIARLVWVRLFADDTGYVTRIVDSNVQLNQSLQKSLHFERELLLELQTSVKQQGTESQQHAERYEMVLGRILEAATCAVKVLPDDTVREQVVSCLTDAAEHLEGRKIRRHSNERPQ